MKTAHFKTFRYKEESDSFPQNGKMATHIHRLIQYTADKEVIKELCDDTIFDNGRGSNNDIGKWIWEIPNKFPREFRWVPDTFVKITFDEVDARYCLSGGAPC